MATITTEVVDTGEKRDKRGHRVLPGAERQRLVAAYQGSGLTMAEFARRESLNYNTFAGWVAKGGRGRAPAATGPIKFAQVQLPMGTDAARSGSDVEVRLPDGTMLRGGRIADLAALIRALRS